MSAERLRAQIDQTMRLAASDANGYGNVDQTDAGFYDNPEAGRRAILGELRSEFKSHLDDMRGVVESARAEAAQFEALAQEAEANVETLQRLWQETAAKINGNLQSLIDRIGSPKGLRRPVATKQVAPPGAHRAYK